MNFLIAALLPGIFLLSCTRGRNANNADPPPVPVTTYQVGLEKVNLSESYPATVTALKQVELRAQVTGYITGILFTEGSRVGEGQRLYEIDRRQYEAAFQQATLNLQIAQENQERIQRDVDRYTMLNEHEAISRQIYDNALTDLANAKLQVSVATQELVKARTNLDFSVIKAPFDGTIGISQVRMGDLVTPGQTLLNTISSDDPMGVDFVIKQSELGMFQHLQERKPTPEDSTFRMIVSDVTEYPASGKLSLIDRAVDPQTGTITVRLVFPNPDHDLRPGMHCDVQVRQESGIPQIVIPFKAVLEQMGEYFVFVTERDKARQVKVALGPRTGTAGVIIPEGLHPGDVIVVDGIEKLVDGAQVAAGPSSPAQKDLTQKH